MSVKRYTFNCYPYFDSIMMAKEEDPLGDLVNASDYDELRDRITWMLECGSVRFTDLWFDEWNRTEEQSKSAMKELRYARRCAREAVEELL